MAEWERGMEVPVHALGEQGATMRSSFGAYPNDLIGGTKPDGGFEVVQRNVRIAFSKAEEPFLQPWPDPVLPSQTDFLNGRQFERIRGEGEDRVFSDLRFGLAASMTSHGIRYPPCPSPTSSIVSGLRSTVTW